MAPVKNIFVTGRPGIGKTTVIQRALKRISTRLNGFYTQEIREDGKRMGFEIRDLEGNSAVMAHVDFDGPPRVSKYGVDPDAVAQIGVTAMRRAMEEGTPAIVDEVGKMELTCDEFGEVLEELLDSKTPVLGSVHAKQDDWADRIRGRDDSVVIELTMENRNTLPKSLAHRLEALTAG